MVKHEQGVVLLIVKLPYIRSLGNGLHSQVIIEKARLLILSGGAIRSVFRALYSLFTPPLDELDFISAKHHADVCRLKGGLLVEGLVFNLLLLLFSSFHACSQFTNNLK